MTEGNNGPQIEKVEGEKKDISLDTAINIINQARSLTANAARAKNQLDDPGLDEKEKERITEDLRQKSEEVNTCMRRLGERDIHDSWYGDVVNNPTSTAWSEVAMRARNEKPDVYGRFEEEVRLPEAMDTEGNKAAVGNLRKGYGIEGRRRQARVTEDEDLMAALRRRQTSPEQTEVKVEMVGGARVDTTTRVRDLDPDIRESVTRIANKPGHLATVKGNAVELAAIVEAPDEETAQRIKMALREANADPRFIEEYRIPDDAAKEEARRFREEVGSDPTKLNVAREMESRASRGRSPLAPLKRKGDNNIYVTYRALHRDTEASLARDALDGLFKIAREKLEE
jgi:hypothetical protein